METLEGVLAEIKGLTDHLALPFREDVLVALSDLRDNILLRNNILEIKEAYARKELKNSHVCRFVEECNIYVITPKCWIEESTTIKIEDGTISGVTEQLAWIDACNKVLKESNI